MPRKLTRQQRRAKLTQKRKKGSAKTQQPKSTKRHRKPCTLPRSVPLGELAKAFYAEFGKGTMVYIQGSAPFWYLPSNKPLKEVIGVDKPYFENSDIGHQYPMFVSTKYEDWRWGLAKYNQPEQLQVPYRKGSTPEQLIDELIRTSPGYNERIAEMFSSFSGPLVHTPNN